jgi:hypothetical protein
MIVLLTKLIDILALVPGTLWGVVVGSFSSLGGVMLTNRSSEKRLEKQFAHDRQLRVKEREHTLRKDVYLAATEAIAASIASVGKFADLDAPNADLAKVVTDRMPMVAKVQVIGGHDVLKSIINFGSELAATFLRLSAHRIPLIGLRQQIALLITQFSTGRDQMLELMKSYNLKGEVDQRRWEAISGNFQFESNRISEALSSKADLSTQLSRRHIDYMKECVQETQRLGQLLPPAVAAVRKELALPMDEVAYAQMVQEAHMKQAAEVDRFAMELEAFVPSNRHAANP